MLYALDRVDADAARALLASAARLGLPPSPRDLAQLLGRLNDDDLEAVTSAWRDQWVAEGGHDQFPDVWVVDRLGEHPWSRQRQVLRSVAHHRKTAVVSAYGIGKSHTASRAVAWFLGTNPPGDAFVVTSAPTFAQVRAILWREIAVAFTRANHVARASKLPSLTEQGHRLNLTEWWIGNEMVGFGRKPSAHAAATFQGIHARKVLVVLDEAGGVPESLFEDAEKLVTTEHSRILAIGNPTHEGTYWHRVCNDQDWNVLQVSAFDTPAYTGERVPPRVLELLTSRLWVDEQARRYGEGSPRYQQQVLGRFSKDRAVTVVPLDWARACINPARPVGVGDGVVCLGVDAAGAGTDWMVVRERRGNTLGRMWRTQAGEPAVQLQLVVQAVNDSGATRVVVDAIGVGHGLVELIRQACPQVEVHAADAAKASQVVRLQDGSTVMSWDVPDGTPTQQVFLNQRAEWWWAARERCMLTADPDYRPTIPYVRAWDLTQLEQDTQLAGDEVDPTLDELCAPGYEHVTRGKGTVIKVESKDELRKATRLGRSTDHADAALLAWWEPPTDHVVSGWVPLDMLAGLGRLR